MVEALEPRQILSGVQTAGHLAIDAEYNALGGSTSFLANPTTNETITANGNGLYRYFQDGLIAWSASTGAHEVHGAIVNRYNELGGSNGSLGLPTTDEVYTSDYSGRVNTFEHGLITYNYASNQTSAIQDNIATKYFALGGLTSFLSVPTSNEMDTPNHDGKMNNFKGGIIVSNATAGTHEVHGAILNKYNELGTTTGFLGFPTSDETFTPSRNGRVSNFQGGTIVYNYASGLTTATATAIIVPPTPSTPPSAPLGITPTIDVLTPPNFREGDVFTATVMDATPGQATTVQVIGDNNASLYQFPSAQIDSNGNATFALRMPYVLSKGSTVDGSTLRVTTGSYTKDFRVTLREGQRVSISTDTIQEGENLTVTIRNGVGNSQIIIQLTHDNNEVVHEWGYMQTDGSGKGTYQLNIPTVLSGGSRVDSYGLRVIQGGVVTDQRIAITEGFRVELGARKVRETVSTFPMGIRNATPNASVTLKWYLDDSYRATQTFRTDGNGNGNFTVSTPKLIKNSSNEDTFRVTVNVNGQSNTFTFRMLVLKYTQTSRTSPDPGGSQVQSVTSAPTRINSAPGVTFHTPTVLGVKSVVSIPKTENQVLGAEDPVVTIQDRMKHQLVILCYGSSEHPGDNAGALGFYDRPGMDQVYEKIQGVTGLSHVMRLWSGNPITVENSAEIAFSEAKNSIMERINLLTSLDQKINSVVLAGYSWGGGMSKRLANWITSTYQMEISGLVYVDAVKHGSTGHQTSLPNVKPSSFLNIYQNIRSALVDNVALGNGHINNPGLAGFDGTAYYGRYRDFDVDTTVDGRKVNASNHVQIDNDEASVVAEFINGVLNGWYGAHRS